MAEQNMLQSDYFQKFLNDEILTPHYNSPHKNIPNSEMAANFWELKEYNKISYRRGALFALYLDNHIRLQSNNKNIRDLLLSIKEFNNNQIDSYQITAEDFIRLASAFLPPKQIISAFNKYIINGDPIIFSPEDLLPIFKISYQNNIPTIRVEKELKSFYQYPEPLINTSNPL